MSYHANIIQETNQNPNFRKVLFTGKKSQLVVMTIPSQGEIGEEIHANVEQTLFFLSGSGEAILDSTRAPIIAGDTIVVTPGTRHNFINTGTEPMKVYTIYAPANHIDARIHETKADADADTEDENFGHTIED
ncbi:MAG: cupin domain-containing protein [Candidatus Gracilibacteria bacterium]